MSPTILINWPSYEPLEKAVPQLSALLSEIKQEPLLSWFTLLISPQTSKRAFI